MATTARKLRAGARVRVNIPKDSALGALHDEEGASRRRTVTVVDPCLLLVDFGWAGQHEIPEAWVEAEVRTGRDLRERGYCLLSIGRVRLGAGRWSPPRYKLVLVDGSYSIWLGVVEGVSTRPSGRQPRASFGRETAQYYVARRRLKSSSIARRPLPERFKTTVDAAHALVDLMEEGR